MIPTFHMLQYNWAGKRILCQAQYSCMWESLSFPSQVLHFKRSAFCKKSYITHLFPLQATSHAQASRSDIEVIIPWTTYSYLVVTMSTSWGALNCRDSSTISSFRAPLMYIRSIYTRVSSEYSQLSLQRDSIFIWFLLYDMVHTLKNNVFKLLIVWEA